ncbi:MAG TPA: hypothetical protein PL033_13850 [Candidatus Brocadiia bacterium]|nr:hypothetical protein [Candidatus Brocadiia bacterium]
MNIINATRQALRGGFGDAVADSAAQEARLFAALMVAAFLAQMLALSMVNQQTFFRKFAASESQRKATETFVILQLTSPDEKEELKAALRPSDAALAPQKTLPPDAPPESKREEPKPAEPEKAEPERNKKNPEQELWFVDTDDLPKTDKPREDTNLIGEKDVAAQSTTASPLMEGTGGRKDAKLTHSTAGNSGSASDAPAMEVVTARVIPPPQPPAFDAPSRNAPMMPQRERQREADAPPQPPETRAPLAPLIPERMRKQAEPPSVADFGNRPPEPVKPPGDLLSGASSPLAPASPRAERRPAIEPLRPERFSSPSSRPLPVSAPESGRPGAAQSIPLFASFSRQGKPVIKEGQDGAAPGKVDLSAIKQHAYAPYLKQVRDKIIYSWHLRYVYDARIFVKIPERPVVISFRTYPGGSIGDVRIEDDAGNSILANALARAIKEAGPLDEFSKHKITERFLSITFHFNFGP